MDKTIAILEQTRRVLRGGNAWARGTWHTTTPYDQYCLVGAIRKSVDDLELEGGKNTHTRPVYDLLNKQLPTRRNPTGTPMWRVIRFNDSRLSYEAIDKLLLKAIDKRRAAIAEQRVHVAEADLSVSGD